MTDRKPTDPLFAGPTGGTATRLCKRPELARERLELGDLRARAGGSRSDGADWTYRVSVRIEAGAEAMALELPGRVALGFGLELLEGAAFCYAPGRPAGGEERPASPLPAVEELRLLGLAAQVALHRSTEADAELAFLVDLCAKTAGQAETSLWPEAQRRESELAPLARAGLIKMQSQGWHSRAFPTAAGRVLAAMLGGALT